MTYLLSRNGNYYYNREVPAIYRDLDPRKKVRVALRTTSKREALRKAIMLDDQVEAYWSSLVSERQKHDEQHFGRIVHTARQMGFSYIPLPAVVNLPLPELVGRIRAVQDVPKQQVEAALGGRKENGIRVSEALEKYWAFSRHKIIDKSDDQIRKWRNPRIKAVKNFIGVTENKELGDITRDDILAFRDWWLDRIAEDEVKPKTANKDFVHLKDVLKTVSGHFKLQVDIEHMFAGIFLKEDSEQTRLPFTCEQLITMLESDKLKEADRNIRWLTPAMAGTGARNTELIGLLPEDIRLHDPVPHIAIIGRKGKKLKTVHSKRVIPLTGYALEAFRAMPEGFPDYRSRPDHLTNKMNRFLRENGFFPSENHSAYSLRHSFQDRLSEVDAPDRVQSELMGHRFSREKYGNGPSLEKKQQWMEKVCLKAQVV